MFEFVGAVVLIGIVVITAAQVWSACRRPLELPPPEGEDDFTCRFPDRPTWGEDWGRGGS